MAACFGKNCLLVYFACPSRMFIGVGIRECYSSPFGFEDGWLIVLVPDHCLSFNFKVFKNCSLLNCEASDCFPVI